MAGAREIREPGPHGSCIGENQPAEKTTGRLTRNLHEWKLPFQPRENQPTLRKQDPASRDLGEQNKKNRTFLDLPAFRKVKVGTIGGTGKNGL